MLSTQTALMLLAGALVIAGLAWLIRAAARTRPRRVAGAPVYRYAGAGGLALQDLGRESVVHPEPSAPLALEATQPFRLVRVPRLPALMTVPPGFDVDAFVRIAKQQFVKLQAAWDAGQRDALRDYTTPELHERIVAELAQRGETVNHTDVIHLEAELLGVAEVASVRFHGTLHEHQDGPATEFDEVWNLMRTTGGRWVLAGIEPLQTPALSEHD